MEEEWRCGQIGGYDTSLIEQFPDLYAIISNKHSMADFYFYLRRNLDDWEIDCINDFIQQLKPVSIWWSGGWFFVADG